MTTFAVSKAPTVTLFFSINCVKQTISLILVGTVSIISVKNTLASSCLCILAGKIDGLGGEFLVSNHRQSVNFLVLGRKLFHRPKGIGGRIQLV